MNLKPFFALSSGLLLAGISAAQTHTVETVPGTTNAYPNAINNDGWLAGGINGRQAWISRPGDLTLNLSPQGPDNELYIHGMNNNGVLICVARPNGRQSFTWTVGQATLNKLPDIGNGTLARSINDSGVVTGNYGGDQAFFHRPGSSDGGFTWSAANGVTILPGVSGNTNTIPMRIANNGTVSGYRSGNGFSWTTGSSVLNLFAVSGLGDNIVKDMNDSQVILGNTSGRAFRFAPGDSAFTFLTAPGVSSFATGISSSGIAVGQYNNGGGSRPCYWLPNSTTPVELPLPIGASLGEATAISSNGLIAGIAVFGGNYVAVIWSPIPVAQTFSFSTKDGDGSAIRANVPYQILNESGVVAASGTTNATGAATATLDPGTYTLVASLHGVFDPASSLCSSGQITVSASGVTGDLNLEIGTLEAYFTVGGRIYRGAGTMTIGGVSKALNRSRAGNWLTDGGNAKSFTATVTINGQTRLIPGTLIAGRDHTTLSFDWNNGS